MHHGEHTSLSINGKIIRRKRVAGQKDILTVRVLERKDAQIESLVRPLGASAN